MQVWPNLLEMVFMVVIIVMSVVIHEVAHGFAAYSLGDPTAKNAGRLTLNPFRHLDLVGSFIVPLVLFLLGGFVIGWAKPVPYDPSRLNNKRWGPAIVAIAGPAANLVLVIVFALILRLGIPAGILNAPAASLMSLVVLLNLSLAIFNLIPVPPLDGSKILMSIFFDASRRLENWFTRYQFLFFIILILVVLNTNFLSRLISYLFTLLVGA